MRLNVVPPSVYIPHQDTGGCGALQMDAHTKIVNASVQAWFRLLLGLGAYLSKYSALLLVNAKVRVMCELFRHSWLSGRRSGAPRSGWVNVRSGLLLVHCPLRRDSDRSYLRRTR
jgi:hypothetical protein